MRFKTFLKLNESPILNDYNLKLGSDTKMWNDITNLYKLDIGKTYDLENDYKLTISKNYRLFVTNKEMKAIGFGTCYLEKISKFNILFIRSFSVKDSERGKGIAKRVYSKLLEIYNALGSDYELTGEKGIGAIGIWKELASKHKLAEVIEDEDRKISLEKIDDLRFGNKDSRFVIFNKPKYEK